jgi:hypothetical protein
VVLAVQRVKHYI